MNKVLKVNSNINVSPNINNFENYLEQLNLPYNDIIAEECQRQSIAKNLPDLLGEIPNEKKVSATYLSKFVAASAIGLFDAALNYVWNEVIINLRRKIVYYGLDVFYDNAIESNRREAYRKEEDLSSINDRRLLDTLSKMEWISDPIYRKLCHILDMRNQIGASHPNGAVINSFELLGWLQFCVKDVINDKLSESAIAVKRIIVNIKDKNCQLDNKTLQTMESSFKDMSINSTSTLMISLFGVYISKDTTIEVKNNILKVSEILWKYIGEGTKYEIGEKKIYYTKNLEMDKAELAYRFLEKCGGLSYLTNTDKSFEIINLCEDLLLANISYNNYHNEYPIAKQIMKFINKADDIPQECLEKLIKTFLGCRIGREVTYCNGVSPSAKKFYDDFFKLLSKDQVKMIITLLKFNLSSFSEGNKIKAENVKEILLLVKSDVLGDRLNEILDYMIESVDKGKIHTLYLQEDFKELCRGVIIF